MNEAKDFAKWLIIHTKDVATLGPCRIYKNKVLNVDELYVVWQNFKQETLTKY
jgi:hypothetical protein